jgi:hypothetical protein
VRKAIPPIHNDKMSLKSKIEEERIKKVATKFAETIVSSLEESVEAQRKADAAKIGLPETATWEEITGFYKQGTYSKLKTAVETQKQIDAVVGADMAGSLEFMSKQYFIFMDYLTTTPENRDAAMAVNRYFNELIAYNGKAIDVVEKTGGNPKAMELFNGITSLLFDVSKSYLIFHNRFNKANYPSDFSELLEQRKAE